MTQYVQYLKRQKVNLDNKIALRKFCRLDLDVEAFLDFSNRNKPIMKWHHPRKFLTEKANVQMRMNNDLGYNRHNTMESNWGLDKEQNTQLVSLLGRRNIRKLKIDPNQVLVRLLRYDPGQQLPLHTDGFEGYKSMFKPKGELIRFFIAVTPGDWGHVLQVHNRMISNWKAGDTYKIPAGVFHASANFGITPKYTLTVTGVKNDI